MATRLTIPEWIGWNLTNWSVLNFAARSLAAYRQHGLETMSLTKIGQRLRKAVPAATPRRGGLLHKRLLMICATAMSLVPLMASAGGLSSLTVDGCLLDNHPAPAVRFVNADKMVPIVFAGEWFNSGECELLVDGTVVASSSGPGSMYPLPAANNAPRTFRLTLRSGDAEMTRYVTLCPLEVFSSSLHCLSTEACFLDSRPEGTVRKVINGATCSVAWSSVWNDGAEGAVVNLYAGQGTGGTKLGELVSIVGSEDGTYRLSPKSLSLDRGIYTLTHFDGIETLIAHVRVTAECFAISFR